MAMASRSIMACTLFFLLLAAAPATMASTSAPTSCVPVLESLMSCLGYIQGQSVTPPPGCCAELNRTITAVPPQPRCLCHILYGNVQTLMGEELFSTEHALSLVMQGGCPGVFSPIANIIGTCYDSPLPPLTPEEPFTTSIFTTLLSPQPPPVSSEAPSGRMQGSSHKLSNLLLRGFTFGALAAAIQI